MAQQKLDVVNKKYSIDMCCSFDFDKKCDARKLERR